METLLQLTGWNFKMAQKRYLLVCSLMAVSELGLLLFTAAQTSYAALPFENLFFCAVAWLPFVLGYIGTMVVCLRPMLGGKSHSAYTVLTLPAKRSTLLLAQIGSTAAALCGLIAVQLLLLVLFYPPVMAVSNATTAGVLQGWPVPTGGTLALSFVRNDLARILLPTSLSGAWTLLLLIAAPSVMLPAAFFQKGRARVGAFVLGVLGAACCGALASTRLTIWGLPLLNRVMVPISSAVLLGLMLAEYLLALRSIKRAAYL